MVDDGDEYHQLMKQKRFLGEIEQGIRLANTEIIHKQVHELSKDKILTLAVAVGRLRARYLDAAVHMPIGEGGEPPEAAIVEDLRTKRLLFEEAKASFEALVDAIEKGYIDVEGL